ncbi:hypothetical protein WJX72_001284 [[Myrmecia] bisecta]|uniref:Uncharacterized protein n=1 Tax=[Myrmecia] bisecta TaxID=41462 RepID=A0AAW1Q8H0_9CHLO
MQAFSTAQPQPQACARATLSPESSALSRCSRLASTSGRSFPPAAAGVHSRQRCQSRRALKAQKIQSIFDNDGRNDSSWKQSSKHDIDEEWRQMKWSRHEDHATASGEAEFAVSDHYEQSAAEDTYTPFPSANPMDTASGYFPFQQGVSWTPADMNSHPSGSKTSNVFVILFGVGEAETEGIYSLRAMSREEELPQDTIIAFAEEEDAERYAGLLEATMEHAPNVCPIEPAELMDFCKDSGYNCRFEPRGSLLIPPDYNVGLTDWERSLKLREGQWSVLETNPLPADAPSSPADMPAPYKVSGSPMLHNNAGAYPLSDANMEEIRARLERAFLE